MKICRICKKPKSYDAYYINKNGSIRGECIVCNTELKTIYCQSMSGRIADLLRHARRRAREKGISFELTRKWMETKFIQQQACCVKTGIKFDLARSDEYTVSPYAPSLDRIDCKEGYTEENTQLVIYSYNAALNEYGESIFENVAMAYLNKKYNFIPGSVMTYSSGSFSLAS